MKYFSGLKKFILKSNFIELAVSFVIGIAFSNLVKAFVTDLITPLIAAISGTPNFANLSFTLNNSIFYYGDFINVFLTFILISIILYSFIIYPIDIFTKKAPITTGECIYCFTTIPLNALKCKACSSNNPLKYNEITSFASY